MGKDQEGKNAEKVSAKERMVNTSQDRHTYATRVIERGMQPKVLQKLLGHTSIKTTMDRYVHVTDDSLSKGARQFECYQTA